jgi:photosystem II stability/assembly factor-like uncharacterized protein
MKKFYILIIGLIILSDASAQWIPQNSGTINNLYSFFFTDVNTGYAAGDAGTLLKTSDGGLNWTVQSSGTDSDLKAIYFPTALTGYAAGDGVIIKTTNGGETWLSLKDTIIANGTWISIDFTGPSTGYFAGSYYNLACILKTYDEGNNCSIIYQDQTPPPPHTLSSYLSSIHFIDPNTGFVAGQRTWDTGTTGGYTGLFFKSSNAGVDWDYANNNLEFHSFSSVCFTDSLTGYLISSIYIGWFCWIDSLIKTTDGGINWSKTNIGSITGNLNIKSIFFTDADTGFIVGIGINGKILKTEDGGESYFLQNSGTTKSLNSVFFTDSHTGYIAGDSGVILKTTNAGGSSAGIENPEFQSAKCKVQCYPNPTGNISHFSFNISQGQWVSLKIYNAQGQEVAVVLDEKLPAGEHTMRWDSGALPAGIYLYQLRVKSVGLVGAGKIVKVK